MAKTTTKTKTKKKLLTTNETEGCYECNFRHEHPVKKKDCCFAKTRTGRAINSPLKDGYWVDWYSKWCPLPVKVVLIPPKKKV